ncbi:MAG: GNAT family N-acetyltransferase [Clostridiales bacterium]|nr:GNAT family N-acetyltransferase [Clostridiales bacterium]
MQIVQLKDSTEKTAAARQILEALQDWFGIPEAREEYISNSADLIFFCARDDEKDDLPVGFLCLKETGKDTAELHVMGVLREYHRRGIGRALFSAARKRAAESGYSFMQVKTVQMGRYEDYDRTNLFYQSLGFKEFEVFPLLWDEANPCQIYVMSLR